jgi:Type VI secretion system VasI, EvfG, VC_A0118
VESITPNEPSSDPTPEETISARTGTAASAVTARPDATRLTLMMVGAAGILAGIGFVLAITWLRGDAPVQTAAAASPAVTAATRPVSPAAVVESGPVPTWTGDRKAAWANDGSKTIVFELQATHEVPVWMSRARPVLVVQCLSRATQTFVVLGSSANFEQDALHRTVRLQWDDAPEITQQWQASESGQELFAPDGVGFARLLTKVNRLRFGFTPFNAKPVTVEFVVQGFDQLAGLVASTCGWKV